MCNGLRSVGESEEVCLRVLVVVDCAAAARKADRVCCV